MMTRRPAPPADRQTPPSPMIEAHELKRRFGRTLAVEGVTFAVPAGAVAGFLGPNGAGKTTTIRMLVGHTAPTSGRAVVAGIDVTGASREARQRIGYLPESTALYPEMRVEEFLRFRSRLYRMRRRDATAAIAEAISLCDLRNVTRRLIGELSKGYRQRVGLAGALLHRPPVLFLDEPTSGLDPTQIQHFRTLVRSLAGERTILVSSHVLAEVEATCDRAVVIDRGRIVADGTLDELRALHPPRVAFEVDGDPTAALATISGIAATEHVTLDGGWRRVTVTAAEARDLRTPLARALATARLTVRELHREETSLERLFLGLAGRGRTGVRGLAGRASDGPAHTDEDSPRPMSGSVA